MNHLRLGVNRLVGRSIPITIHVTRNITFVPSSSVTKLQNGVVEVNKSFKNFLSLKNNHHRINYINSSCSYSLFKSKNAEANPPSGNSKEGNNDTNQGTEQQQSPSAADNEIEAQLRQELSKTLTEMTTLRTKAKEFEEKYLLALADMENLRKRMTKQVNDGKLYATQGFCKDLTEIEDILQLAINSVPKEEIKSNKHLKELYEGLVMTEARLLQVFKAHGLTQINPLNSKFNPNEHEAVMQKEEEGKESGTVIFVSKLGYKLHDRVIRPAVVGVAK